MKIINNFVSEEPQKLTPKDLKMNPGAGFGYAFNIENAVDIDKNLCDDFAVGAPFDDKTAIYKTYKVYSFKLASDMTLKSRNLDPNSNDGK